MSSAVAALARIAACLGALALSAPQALACGAIGGDNRVEPGPCASTHGVVQYPDEPSPASATANSVDLVTGNKYFAVRDADWPGGLGVARHYNSRNDFPQRLGPGWRLGFDTVLAIVGRRGTPQVQIIQGDGRRVVFEPVQGATSATGTGAAIFGSVQPGWGIVRRQPDLSSDRRWEWRRADGTSLHFDVQGLLRMVEHPLGVRLSFEHARIAGGAPRLVRVRNRHGDTLRIEYDSTGMLIERIVLPDGGQLAYRYDPHGVLVSVHRDEVRLWTYEHDDAHPGAIVVARDADGRPLARVRYDATGRVVYSARSNERDAIALRYELPQRAWDIGRTVVSPVGGGADAATAQASAWRWRYDPRSQRRQIVSAQGPGCAACPPTGLTYAYDSAGNLLAGKPPPFTVRRAGASHAHRIEAIERASVAPGRMHRIAFGYDTTDRVTSVHESGFAPEFSRAARTPANAAAHRITWRAIERRWTIQRVGSGPAVGLPLIIDGPLPGADDAARFVYDAGGRLVARYGPHRRETHWRYDARGWLVERFGTDGHVRLKRDAWHRIIGIERNGVTRRFTLDAQGRRTRIESSTEPPIQLAYDADGELTDIADDHGHRIIRVPPSAAEGPRLPPSAPGLALVEFAHGMRHWRKPASGEFERQWFDDFGRLLASVDSEMGVERTVYDALDRPIARADSAGSLERWIHGPNGEVARIERPDGVWLEREWHPNGLLVSERDRVQHSTWRHDPQRRAVEHTLHYRDDASGQSMARALTLSRRFDAGGRLVGSGLGNGWSLRFDWSTGNELEGIALIGPDGGTTTLVEGLRWLPFTAGRHGLVSARLGNGIGTRFSFDDRLRVARISHRRARLAASGTAAAPSSSIGSNTGPDQTLPDVTLTYDRASHVSSQRIEGTHPLTTRYTHDGHRRLERIESDAGRQALRYGADGTRIQPGEPARASTIGGLRIAANGALLDIDRFGRARHVITRDRSAWRYLYNHRGERIGKLRVDAPEQTRWFVYENGRPTLTLDGQGRPLLAFVYLDARPLAVVSFARADPEIHWVHTDALGQPLALTDARAAVTWQGRPTPFGGYPAEAPPDIMPLRLPGQYADAESGLSDNVHRTYDPTRGRYLGPDPLGLRAGGMRYAYARNSPLDTTDPLGLYEVDMHYYTVFVIAMAAGMSYEQAITTARASQYVDDSGVTEPIVRTLGVPNYALTGLTRGRVLRDWHFVLDRDRDNRDIGRPRSRRLTELRAWAQAATDPQERFFRIGVFAHPFLDSAAHRLPDGTPYFIPNTGIALGHGADGHAPDKTHNHCTEGFYPDGELVDEPGQDAESRRTRWSSNEARTLAIEQGLFEVLQDFTGADPRLSWEELQPMLERLNAIPVAHAVPNDPGMMQKLAMLEAFLREHGITGPAGERIRFSSQSDQGNNINAAYDLSAARTEWDQYWRGGP